MGSSCLGRPNPQLCLGGGILLLLLLPPLREGAHQLLSSRCQLSRGLVRPEKIGDKSAHLIICEEKPLGVLLVELDAVLLQVLLDLLYLLLCQQGRRPINNHSDLIV